jgi:hypothetical protein
MLFHVKHSQYYDTVYSSLHLRSSLSHYLCISHSLHTFSHNHILILNPPPPNTQHTHLFFTQVLKGHDHVIESVCFGKKPAAVPLLPPPPASGSTASAASLNLMDISQKTEKTDDTSLVDIIGVNRPFQSAYFRLFYFLGWVIYLLTHSTCTSFFFNSY